MWPSSRRPSAAPRRSSRAGSRGRIVGTGATLTAASLILGSLLVLLGLVDAVSSGIDGLSIAILVVGAVLVSTHWGWVHVAELTANSIEGRSTAEVEDRRGQWLSTIQPYPRFEITTSVEEDGSITIERVAYRPVVSGERRFTFAREIEQEEVHPADEPAATVTERAELLRRRSRAGHRTRTRALPDRRRRLRIRAARRRRRAATPAGAARGLGSAVAPDQLEPP